jgi:23S rRNA (cytosine1962-C5)-methyltransferase
MLLAAALAVLAPGGRVLACINHAGVDARRFHELLQDGLRLARRTIISERAMPQPLDFPSGRMKAVLLEVA